MRVSGVRNEAECSKHRKGDGSYTPQIVSKRDRPTRTTLVIPLRDQGAVGRVNRIVGFFT